MEIEKKNFVSYKELILVHKNVYQISFSFTYIGAWFEWIHPVSYR